MAVATETLGLYPKEKLETVYDSPILSYFSRGSDPSKPLVVYIPGAYHLARIAYGGHEGCRPEDFLAHWYVKAGYSFLGISYPLEMNVPIMPASRPDFTVSDWGKTAVDVTKQTLQEHRIENPNVILLYWSMGGKILQPYTLEARQHGLDVELGVALVSTPALRGLRERPPKMTPSKNGYAFHSGYEAYFMMHTHEENAINGGREIIPDDIFVREYMGNFPITMGAWGFRYEKLGDKHTFIEDEDAGFEAADTFPLGDLPFLGSIIGDSPLDFRHTVTDRATWGVLTTHQLMGFFDKVLPVQLESGLPLGEARRIAAVQKRLWTAKNGEKARKAVEIIQGTVAKMSCVVEGNHFFFIGEKGAKRTVEETAKLLEFVKDFKSQVTGLLGT